MLDLVQTLAFNLISQHPALFFNSAPLESGKVRLHFAGYNSEIKTFQPFAGLTTARRIWSRQPEPTVIFGFENQELLQRSDDVVILEQEAVAWLPFTATHDEIKQAIEQVLQAPLPTNNDPRIDSLTEKDFNIRLQNFSHFFKPNMINTLGLRNRGLLSNDPDDSQFQYTGFKNGKPDYIKKQKVIFENIENKYEPIIASLQCNKEWQMVVNYLADADRVWQEVLVLAQESYSSQAVEQVAAKVSFMISVLEKMHSTTRIIRSQLEERLRLQA